MSQTIKAVSLTQPWATLVAIGAKKIETRSFSRNYRGLLAIHASKLFPRKYRVLCSEEPFKTALSSQGFTVDTLPLQSVVAVCDLIDIEGVMLFNIPDEPERSFGDYAMGRYLWRLGDLIYRLPEPIWVKGALGLWDGQPAPETMDHIMSVMKTKE